MPVADELQKLQDLLRAGTLTREEFEQAKRKVLSDGPAPAPPPPPVIIEQPRQGLAGCAVLLGLLVIAGIIAAATKPNEAAMKKAIVDKRGLAFAVGAALEENIGTAKYTYHDYVVFSTMTMSGLGRPEKTIAYGVFGQVIVTDP